jgi:FKBP-type peptidyl-prolyl cis-trans isomerase FklB
MKKTLTIIVGICLLASVCWAKEQTSLTGQKARESYSLGYQFGQFLKQQGLEIDLKVYSAAIRDALGEKKPRLTKDEIRLTVAELQKRIAAAEQKEQNERAAKNLAEGKAFLEKNKKKDGVRTLPSGLQYKVLKDGDGPIPQATDTVTVRYRCTLIDGTEFDPSSLRGESTTASISGMIKGWAEALQLMKVGGKWQLFIPPDLAYGERQYGPVQPNSTLIFELELLSIGKPSQP